MNIYIPIIRLHINSKGRCPMNNNIERTAKNKPINLSERQVIEIDKHKVISEDHANYIAWMIFNHHLALREKADLEALNNSNDIQGATLHE